MKLFALVFVLFNIYFIYAIPRPSYISACHRNDPDLDKCAEEMAKIAIPEIAKGDPAYNIPKMNPMFLEKIDLAISNLRLKARNVTVKGLDTAVPKKFHFNLTTRDLTYEIYCPSLEISGNYILKGQLLILPIDGNGFTQIKYVNGTYTYKMHYELFERKGVKYMNTTVHSLTFNCERAYYHFTNLFNGNKALEDSISKLMDGNWKEVNKDFGPLIAQAIDQIGYHTSNAIFNKVPYDDVFLP